MLCQQAQIINAPSLPPPTLPQVRLRFLPSLPCFSWTAAIAPSTQRELRETLGLDSHRLLPIDYLGCLRASGHPSSPQHPAKPRLHARGQPSTGTKSWVTFSRDYSRGHGQALRQHSSPEGPSLPEPAAHPFPTIAHCKLQFAEQCLGNQHTAERCSVAADVCTDPHHCACLINAIQHEWTTGHGPGCLMPILDHSRVLETETIPLHSFWGLPGTMLFSMAQTPQPALLHRCCRTTGLGDTWEIPIWSPTPGLHFRWGRKFHLSPIPKRDDQIRATPMLSPQSSP